jgi:hypothetical protein
MPSEISVDQDDRSSVLGRTFAPVSSCSKSSCKSTEILHSVFLIVHPYLWRVSVLGSLSYLDGLGCPIHRPSASSILPCIGPVLS